MKLVVGLGNPGPRYEATRHNVGFLVVERFAERCGIALDAERFEGRFGRGWLPGAGEAAVEVGVLEPLTWMNHSGTAVAAAARELGVANLASDLFVVFDDVDLPFGRLRLRPGGGAGGHRGVSDVIDALDTQEFPRLRFGVGRSEAFAETADWVLAPFGPEEAAALSGRLAAAADALATALREGVTSAMNRFNRDPAADDEKSVQ